MGSYGDVMAENMVLTSQISFIPETWMTPDEQYADMFLFWLLLLFYTEVPSVRWGEVFLSVKLQNGCV